MELEGRIWKDGRTWLVEVPSLCLMTQGKTRKNALDMIQDAIHEIFNSYFEGIPSNFRIMIQDYKGDLFGVRTSEPRLLLSLSLIRQREESGTSIRDAAARLGSKSPNSYSQYEQGRTMMSLEKYEQLLKAANPLRHSILRIV